MALIFKEDTHEYFLDEKLLISVTQLMRKHNLAPDYGNVPQAVLSAKAERGTLIHKEIEDYNKKGEIGFTNECSKFASYVNDNNVDVILSECVVDNDVVAGTIDLILYKDGKYTIADIKTTSKLHKESISWQLSIYAYLFNQLHKDTLVNVKEGQAYHFDKDGVLNVVDIPLKPFEEIEKLLQCEREGVKYQKPLQNSIDISRLSEIECQIKELQDEENVLKENLIKSMEEKKLDNLEDERIAVTYVAPVTKSTLDSKQLKKDHPDIAEKYQKTSISKASLRIKVKGE